VPSRQDQLHSYQYSLQRVVAALVTHDPDPARSPLRKAGTTALVSVLVASLAVGGAAIYGLLTGHTSADPTDTKVVFQEKGSGARYVYLASDQKLHPVTNYVSGVLLAEGDAPKLETITPERLADVPLGAPLGIPGAPDSVPGPDALITGRWSVCTDNKGDNNAPRTTVLVGDELKDGQVAADPQNPRGIVVTDQKRTMLIYKNRRYTMPPEDVTATTNVLGVAFRKPWPVSAAWADAVPLGHDLVAPQIAGFGGTPGFQTDLKIGQVLQSGSDNTFAVVLKDGWAAVTPLQARLLRVSPTAPGLRSVDNFSTLPHSTTVVSDSGNQDALPQEAPAVIDFEPTRVCFTEPTTHQVNGNTAIDGIRYDPAVPTALPVTGTARPGKKLADLVHVARGKGAVVLGVPAQAEDGAATGGTFSVVTDTGVSYPMASHDVLVKLGYGEVDPQRVPTQFTDLLPVGAALDPAAALKSGGVSPSASAPAN
jgi:type VII secretion protein EccB